MRIVSLIPSSTEIACRLGLREALVGVTHECDFPAGIDALPTVTRSLIPVDAASAEIDRLVTEQVASEPSLYALDAEQLEALRPDLIVTQSLCDMCAVPDSDVEQVAISPRAGTVQWPPRTNNARTGTREGTRLAGRR